jgi:hypothetical protein
MSKQLIRSACAGFACAAVIASLPAKAATADAATVEFTIGDVKVIGLNGQSRRAIKGLQVHSGDTVDTAGGRAQLRFSDGAYVSLQPQSKFRIDEYRFDGKTDGTERGFFSLLSGGMRTITGLVGRTNKRTYQVTTSVATIGIRGTEYKIAYTNSIDGMVGEGAIDVCTGAGCFPFKSGETFMVSTPQSTPQLTQKQVDLPPQPPGDPPGGSYQKANDSTNGTGGGPRVAGNEVGEDGSPAQQLRLTGPISGMIRMDNSDGFRFFDGTEVTFDASGTPEQLNRNPLSDITDVGNDGLLSWWREPNAGLSTGNFTIVGLPTPLSELQSQALAQPVATYSLIGGTGPVGYQSLVAPFGATEGKLLAASLTAYFTAASVDATVSVSMVGKQMDMQTKGMTITATPAGNAKFDGGTCTLSGGGCNMAGFFAGPAGNRAALGYSGNIYDPITQQSVSASGAVGLEVKR